MPLAQRVALGLPWPICIWVSPAECRNRMQTLNFITAPKNLNTRAKRASFHDIMSSFV